jgi:hypothetical protein
MLYLLGFLYLDFAARANYLHAHGRPIASRTEGEFEVQLYWTPNFFAEVYFSTVHNRSEKISAIIEKPFFENYLEQIILPQLLKQ